MQKLLAGYDNRYLPIFLFGLIGGLGAKALGIPMPFMLGGIIGSACFVLWYERKGNELPKVPRWVRQIFMAIIGVMIGARFTPDVLVILPNFWISVLALFPYILIGHAGSYAIMRGLGRYDKRDAFFASLPGGIIDSAALAEKAGADLRVVTTQHFIRILFVVSCVPLLFLFIEGDAVGSMGGQSMASADYGLHDVVLTIGIAAVGLVIGHRIRLPVSHMLGPLLITLVLSIGSIVHINQPGWLVDGAQFIIGTALGAQFSGVSHRLLVRGLGMGILAGCYMLSLAAFFALLLIDYVPAEFGAMFVSFTAGGVAEMSLIAISLNFNPVVVALHHLIRILFTVYLGDFLFTRVFKLMKPA